MKIAVLGGAGLTGRCAVRALAESEDVESGVVGDIDISAAREVATTLGQGKFKAARVDVTDRRSTVRALSGCDVVINGVQYYFNVETMEAALEAGANYIDFGGLFHTTLLQLKRSREFAKRGLVAIVGMGGMPGMTNVIARMAADELDRIHSLEIRDGARDLTKGVPPFFVTWSLDTFLDELMLDVPVFENGRRGTVPALSRRETVDFPEPVGTLDTYCTIHSEVATLPVSFKDKGLRKVDWMEGAPGIEGLRLLVNIGLASKEVRTIGGVTISPRKFLISLIRQNGLIGYPKGVVPNDWEVTRVTAIGTQGKRKVRIRYDITIPPRKEWRMSCAQYGVGIPASIVARMIGRGEIKTKGVVPPEVCVDPRPFMKELRSYGFKIDRTVSAE